MTCRIVIQSVEGGLSADVEVQEAGPMDRLLIMHTMVQALNLDVMGVNAYLAARQMGLFGACTDEIRIDKEAIENACGRERDQDL